MRTITASLRLLRRFLAVLFAASLSLHGQMRSEPVVLVGYIRNETANEAYDNFHIALHERLADVSRFSRTVCDTMVRVDSFPDEASLLRAHNSNASHLLWGCIEGSGSNQGITLRILDMAQASVSHITMVVDRNDDRKAVVETVLSKLEFWLERTTMCQLIMMTQPSGASVTLDGMHLGTTPFEKMVEPGTYLLDVEKRTFLPVHLPVSFVSGNTYHYDIALGTAGEKNVRRPVMKWLGITAALCGIGGIAHWQCTRAQQRYRDAVPPADFDALHQKVAAWNVGRIVSFSAAGASGCIMIMRIAF